MSFHIRIDDLSSTASRALVAEHLAGMHENSPAGHVHAIAIGALQAPDVTFWTAWMNEQICGCVALKALDTASGEVKSMRTLAPFLRQGVGQRLLNTLVSEAESRGYQRLFLETGTGPAFDAAHAMYRRNGFDWCDAFGDYESTDFNVFMCKNLGHSPSVAL